MVGQLRRRNLNGSSLLRGTKDKRPWQRKAGAVSAFHLPTVFCPRKVCLDLIDGMYGARKGRLVEGAVSEVHYLRVAIGNPLSHSAQQVVAGSSPLTAEAAT
jgi:hypothetical protein